MSFAASTSRQVLRRSTPARLSVPWVRFESTANTVVKGTAEAAKGAAETVKGAAETAKAAAGSAKSASETAAQKAAGSAKSAGETATQKAAGSAKSASETAAQKATEFQEQAAAQLAKASEYSKQAAQGLARAGASAQAFTKQLSEKGGNTGRLAGVVDKQIPFVVYYSRVAIETAKIIFQAQKMAPPPLSTFQAYGNALLARLKNPSELVKTAHQLIQNARAGVSTAQLVSGTVVAAECLGFFTVGEMIGRFKIVGYRGKLESSHH